MKMYANKDILSKLEEVRDGKSDGFAVVLNVEPNNFWNHEIDFTVKYVEKTPLSVRLRMFRDEIRAAFRHLLKGVRR